MNIEQAEQLLNGLGSTADDVAHSLQDQGITGTKKNCFSCPIAVFLEKNGANIRYGAVGKDIIYLDESDTMVPTPPAIKDFIQAFDEGAYPDLIGA